MYVRRKLTLEEVLGEMLQSVFQPDELHRDLCVALDATPLRGPRDRARRALLDPFERVLGGRYRAAERTRTRALVTRVWARMARQPPRARRSSGSSWA